MIKVKEDKYGRFIEGKLDLSVEAYLNEDDTRTEIPESEARPLLRDALYNMAQGSGTETLANADFTIVN